MTHISVDYTIFRELRLLRNGNAVDVNILNRTYISLDARKRSPNRKQSLQRIAMRSSSPRNKMRGKLLDSAKDVIVPAICMRAGRTKL